MGRVKDFKQLGNKGPGRKSRKQSEPDIPSILKDFTEKSNKDGSRVTKLGGRIRQRTKKRLLKKVAVESTKKLSKKVSEMVDNEEEEKMIVANEEQGNEFCQ